MRNNTSFINRILCVMTLTVLMCANCACSLELHNEDLPLIGKVTGAENSALENPDSLSTNEETENAETQSEPPVISFQDTSESVIVDEPEEPEEVEEDIYDPVNKIYTIHAADENSISLCFAGDVSFYEDYANMGALRKSENGITDCILPEVMDYMHSADIMMVNNEFPYSDGGSPTPNKTYTFRARPESVSLLSEMGVDIVSLANNHAYDYGPVALTDTVDILNEAKVPFVGAGKNIEEASKPVYFHINDRVIAYVSATQIERYNNPDTCEATEDAPGVMRTYIPDKFLTEIEAASENSDFVVVYVHWGSELTDLVDASQKELAAKYVEAGADLIIGDHSHCLQGVDYVDGVPVFYSLGNFWFNGKSLDTCLAWVELNEYCGLSKVRFIPCRQVGGKTRIADEDEWSRIIRYMRGISGYALFDEDGYITYTPDNQNTQGGVNTCPVKRSEPAPVIDPNLLLTPEIPEIPETP